MGVPWWDQQEFVAADILELTDPEKEVLGKSLVAFLEVVGARRILHCLDVSIADLEDCLYGKFFTVEEMILRATLHEEHELLLSIQKKVLASIEELRTRK